MKQDAPLRLSDFLPYQLSVAAESVSRAFAECYEAEFALSIPEWRVMAVLGEAGSVATRDVIARTEMDRARVSRAAIRLAEKGLVTRTAPPGDARAHVLRLSRSGRALYDRIVPRAHEIQAALSSALRPEELTELARLLAVVRQRAGEALA